MKNQIGFINENRIQPDYYKKFFGNWAAVYIINDSEYHIQSVSDPYDINNKEIAFFEVLKQNKDGRMNLTDKEYKNLNNALKVIRLLKEKESRDNMKKYIMAEAKNNIYKVVLSDEQGKKTFLNGNYKHFKEADAVAKQQANEYEAVYVCNS
jgi:hypothetical protein